MKKVLELINFHKVELVAVVADGHTDLHIRITFGEDNPTAVRFKDEMLHASLRKLCDCSYQEFVERVRPVLLRFNEIKNCTYKEHEELFARCYTEPQIERGYQAMLELWQALKTASTTKPPRRIVAESKLKELFK